MSHFLKYGLVVLSAGCLFLLSAGCNDASGTAETLDRPPRIDPDYAGIIIPPNIAPLNFRIREPADRAVLEIAFESGGPIVVKARDGVFRIPIRPWKRLLEENRGGTLTLTVRIRKDGRWQAYRPIVNRIAEDPVDSYLAYRLINPAYSLWTVMGLYQRNLETFDERPILVNRLTDDNCMNCHHFRDGDPDVMLMHLRGGAGSGTLIRRNDQIFKVNTATDFNRAGAYPTWHPDGNLIAFSVNQLTMFFHARGESRDVLDSASDLVIYDIERNLITTNPGIADPDRMETFPCWAPDGRTLYFCAADRLDQYVADRDGREDLYWENIRYDLMRIAYDPVTQTWGAPETVISAEQIGGSITLPRVSPDGTWLMFTRSDYSNFPVYLKSADLYLLHLPTLKYRRLECNSDQVDSYHSWSRNSRWFVFSSKRQDGLLARPYLSALSPDGRVSKPVLMPQKDPAFYESFLQTYNVPELVSGPVRVDPRTWARTAMGENIVQAGLDPDVKPGRPTADSPDLYQKASR